MVFDKSMFIDLNPLLSTQPQHVTLEDGVTNAIIYGIGTIRIQVYDKYILEFHDVLFVSSLSFNLLSLRELLSLQGCFIHGHHSTLIVGLHKLRIPTIIQHVDIYIPYSPSKVTPHSSTTSCVRLPHPYLSTLARLMRYPSKLSPQLLHPTNTSISDPALIPTDLSNPQSPPLHPSIPKQPSTDKTPPPLSPTLPPWVDHNTKVILRLSPTSPFERGILLFQMISTSFIPHPLTKNTPFTRYPFYPHSPRLCT